MPDSDGLDRALIDYIQKEVNSKAPDIDPDTDLLGGEVLDSLGILAVIGYLEERFGFEIEPVEVSLDSFRTIRAICSLVAVKLLELPGNEEGRVLPGT